MTFAPKQCKSHRTLCANERKILAGTGFFQAIPQIGYDLIRTERAGEKMIDQNGTVKTAGLTLLIFGGTGIWPTGNAAGALPPDGGGRLPEDSRVIAIGRRPKDNAGYREEARALGHRPYPHGVKDGAMARFLERLSITRWSLSASRTASGPESPGGRKGRKAGGGQGAAVFPGGGAGAFWPGGGPSA